MVKSSWQYKMLCKCWKTFKKGEKDLKVASIYSWQTVIDCSFVVDMQAATKTLVWQVKLVWNFCRSIYISFSVFWPVKLEEVLIAMDHIHCVNQLTSYYLMSYNNLFLRHLLSIGQTKIFFTIHLTPLSHLKGNCYKNIFYYICTIMIISAYYR